MDCYSQYLKVDQGTLFGRRHFWSKWRPIASSEITDAKEYGFNNPFIKIWTDNGTYFVGALRRQYRPVTEYLKRNTRFDLSATAVHSFNEALYQKDILGREDGVQQHGRQISFGGAPSASPNESSP